MAAQIISLGIGAPATIPYFLLVGLSVNAAAETLATADYIIRVRDDVTSIRCSADVTTIEAQDDTGTVRLP